MAVTAWAFYNTGKEYIGDNTTDLDTDIFYLSLHTSASNAGTATLITYASVDNEVTSANGYTTGGKQLSAITWNADASASEMRWDTTARIWSASGGNIANVKYAVLRSSAGNLLAVSTLSTAQFTVTSGNAMTLTPSANGIFELN